MSTTLVCCLNGNKKRSLRGFWEELLLENSKPSIDFARNEVLCVSLGRQAIKVSVCDGLLFLVYENRQIFGVEMAEVRYSAFLLLCKRSMSHDSLTLSI